MEIEEIYNFLHDNQGVEKNLLSPEVDLNLELGIEGDDFFELEEEFSQKYRINMDSYKWYFHHAEEGLNIGAYFFPPPDCQVEHIPVTPSILLKAAKTQIWPIEYPPHSINSRKGEIIVNYGIFALSALLIVVGLLHAAA